MLQNEIIKQGHEMRGVLGHSDDFLPVLGAAVVGGVVQVDGNTRQVHDVTHWGCVSLQAV